MRRFSFWVAVGLVGGVVTPVVLNLAADRTKWRGLRELNAYVTRKNG